MKFLSSKKGKIVFCMVLVALLTAAGIFLALKMHKKEYRSISVEAVNGSVIVSNEKNEDQAYKGQRLYGGDDVTVKEDSDLTMCMDNNKYLYADENTHFRLENHSKNNVSRIRIILDKGSELNELTEKLNADESYAVDTPNSTMSVRGTKFRVTVFTGSDGYVYTLLEVEEGVVLVQLKTVNGEYNGVEKEFTAGQSALIRADAGFSEFVKSKQGEEALVLDYAALPKEHLERLKELIKDNNSKPDRPEAAPTPAEEKKDPPAEHTHTQGEFEVTEEPGCETKGVKTAKCTECGEIIVTEDIDPLGHVFSDWTSEKAASCNEEGSEIRECKRCGQTQTRVIEATGKHDWGKLVEDKAPGCLTEGSAHYVCTVCGSEGAAKTLAAKGHSFSGWKTVKEATCKEQGTQSRKCSGCGKTETKKLAMTDHKWSAWKTVRQATCADEGSEERSCTVCAQKETRSIAATGNHSWGDVITDVEAGCITDGSGHYECTVCGAEGTHVTIPKKGHDYKEYSKENIDSEHYKVIYKCDNCGESYSATKAGQV
ncbi:MAG: FecR domain-containing protein [Lachnospiraceae bacterium]|nr:FecR domain-containing protein [Lachnospiraceae bacterium]